MGTELLKGITIGIYLFVYYLLVLIAFTGKNGLKQMQENTQKLRRPELIKKANKWFGIMSLVFVIMLILSFIPFLEWWTTWNFNKTLFSEWLGTYGFTIAIGVFLALLGLVLFTRLVICKKLNEEILRATPRKKRKEKGKR